MTFCICDTKNPEEAQELYLSLSLPCNHRKALKASFAREESVDRADDPCITHALNELLYGRHQEMDLDLCWNADQFFFPKPLSSLHLPRVSRANFSNQDSSQEGREV